MATKADQRESPKKAAVKKPPMDESIPAWPFVAPFLVFMITGFFDFLAPEIETPPVESNEVEQSSDKIESSKEDSDPNDAGQADEESKESIADYYEDTDVQAKRYLIGYLIRIVIVFIVLVAGWKIIYRQFPFKISFWCWIYGIVGIVLWVAISNLAIEHTVLSAVGMENWLPERSQFNPFAHLDEKPVLVLFLVARFFGLAVVVPIMEELFLRGFLMRFIKDPEFWTVKLASLGVQGIVIGAIYGAATHPEVIAAIVWFSLISLLMWQTGNLWDCIVAHSVTNLLLGVYVVTYGQWYLW